MRNYRTPMRYISRMIALNVGENVWKLEFSYIVIGNVTWYNYFG